MKNAKPASDTASDKTAIETSASHAHSVPCPQCGAEVIWSPASRWRPFCSERCKLLDFGAWSSESYRIATEELPEGNGNGSGDIFFPPEGRSN